MDDDICLFHQKPVIALSCERKESWRRNKKMNGYIVRVTMDLFVEAENEQDAHLAVNDALETSGLIIKEYTAGEAVEYNER
jgi:hypothetical protein